MDTVLDTKNWFLSSVCFRLLPTDVAWDNIVFFCSCRVIALAYLFWKMAPFTAIMDAISLLLSETYNDILNAYGISPADKIEQRITFYLCHVRLYLAE